MCEKYLEGNKTAVECYTEEAEFSFVEYKSMGGATADSDEPVRAYPSKTCQTKFVDPNLFQLDIYFYMQRV